MSTHSAVTTAPLTISRRPTLLWAARLALLAGLFPPPPTSLEKRVRRALLLLLTVASSGGALAWLALSRDSDLAWPLAIAIAGALIASAVPWHDLPSDAFAMVGIAAAAWVAWFVWLTGGPYSAQQALAFIPVLVCALGASQRVASPLGLAVAATAGLPLIYGNATAQGVREDLTLVAILGAFAIGGPFLLREARAAIELQQTASKRSEYYAVVAHELRNPLIGIRAMAKILVRQLPESRRVEYIAALEAESSAALALLDGLTDIASIESGRLRLALRPVELTGVVREVTNALRSGGHAISVTGDEQPLIVAGDERRIGQVLRNLVSNAVKYSPDGAPIELSVTTDRHAAIVRVHDAGPGVPVSERDQLFQKFTRLSTAGATRGSGLGLYISSMIVRDHHGELWAEWPADGGSVFGFSVPLAPGG